VENSLRLVGNEQKIGRLEIFHNGTWGTICDDLFNVYSARVACFSLGFGYVAITRVMQAHMLRLEIHSSHWYEYECEYVYGFTARVSKGYDTLHYDRRV